MRNLKSQYGNPVIFFDGVCVLCNGAVNFLLRADRKNIFRYAPLQGLHAGKFLAPYENLPDSIVYSRNGKIYLKMDAVIRIAFDLGGFWRIGCILCIIPKYFRDCIYDVIAKNRFRWFGKYQKCRVPEENEKELFLN